MAKNVITNFHDAYERWEGMTKEEIIAETGSEAVWEAWHTAKRGEMVIRLIEGGNEYMKVGDPSCCGMVRAFAVGLPIVVVQPNGAWYQSSCIREIDWEKGIFRTECSTYTFHFVNR